MKERELLESFKEWYNKRYKSPILFEDIKSFLSSRPEEKEETKWIPTSEKMPESGQCVLLYSKNGGVAEGAFLSTKGYYEQWRWNSILKFDSVTHWMPLPEFNPNNQ